MTDGMREAYGASKVSQPNTPTPRAVEAVAHGRDIIVREIAISRRYAEKPTQDGASSMPARWTRDADALESFLAHVDAITAALAEKVEVPECVRALVDREIDSLRTSQNTLRMCADGGAHGTTWADDLDRQKRLRATEERLAKVTATLAALEAWLALLSGPEVGE